MYRGRRRWQNSGVNKRSIISSLLVVFVATIVLFEVHFVFDIGGSMTARIADPEIEAAFDDCYAKKDEEIHTTAFGTIDNPDVQKEFITSSRARAVNECRALYPETMIDVETPARFNIVDLTPRFW